MSGWQRQTGLACEFCGRPGHLIAVSPPVIAAFSADLDALSVPTLATRITCPVHREIVRQKAEREQDPARFAARHGRPDEWGRTNPERLRDALRTLIDRLKDQVPEQAAELEQKARDKGIL